MTIKPKKSLSQNFLIDRDVLNKIVETVNNLLEDKGEYKKMSKASNPYGDGLASIAISKSLLEAKL